MTDKRLIDATEVERVFNQWLGEADSLAEQEAIECCIAHIHDTPAVDPKSLRGHARWVKDENVKINKLLDSKFTRDDIELIYTYLGNGIQHDLCLRFVASGYDLEVLREYDKKQEAGSNGKT